MFAKSACVPKHSPLLRTQQYLNQEKHIYPCDFGYGDKIYKVKGDPKKLKKLAKDDERGSGNILRINDDGQLKLTEAAIDDLRKIVKTKSMGKVSGTKVDLFSASAMVQVYDALNDKNRAKVDKMLKDKRGVMTFADFAMSQATKK